MSAPTKIKICGIKTAEAATVAASAGADYLGFNFVEGVRRQLQAHKAQEIVTNYRASLEGMYQRRSDEPRLVGLFRDQDLDWVNRITRQMDLDCVQLHGAEDESYMRGVHRQVFRQVRIRPETSRDELSDTVQKHLIAGRVVLLDHFDPKSPGGSGKTFDWSIAEGVASRQRVMLAGGLTPENVGQAIKHLSPWGVDVASGVETDGEKDHDKIRAFVDAVRTADSAS